MTFSQAINPNSVSAVDFSNASSAPITIGAINQTAPNVFTIQVTPSGTGSLLFQIPSTAVITNNLGRNLIVPVRDSDNINIILDPTNKNPVANPDSASTQFGKPATISVLLNDTDADGDALLISSATTPSHGAVVINGQQTITYTPNVGFSGNDNFTYTTSDGNGGSASATVLVTTYPQGTLIVDNSTDIAQSGKLSLREAITQSNQTPEADLIVFDDTLTGKTITLNGTALPVINSVLTISGPGANLLTISGNNQSRIMFISNGSTGTISGLTFTKGNTGVATLVAGGGINNQGTLTVINSAFIDNFASAGGGGIGSIGTLTVLNSTFAGNQARDGGAISFAGTTTVTNSTISGNTSTGPGGGIFAFGPITITNSTIVNNKADTKGTGSLGGGINIQTGKATFINTIVAGNIGAASAASDVGGIIDISSTNNIISDAKTAGGLTNNYNSSTNTGNIVGVVVSDVINPTLALNGGTTMTHSVPLSSPAIGTGSKNGATTDQRGFPRPTPTHPEFSPEIGAFEVQVANLITTNLPAGKVGVAYGQQLIANFLNLQPYNPTYTYVADSPLPTGLVFSSSGILSGTPTRNGDFTFNVSATTNTGDIVFSTPVTVSIASSTQPVLVGYKEFSVSADGGGSLATLYNFDASPRFTVTPFPGFSGGIRTASADFNRDGIADLVTGTGPGRSTRVIIFDGQTRAELFTIDPFEASFKGGVFVAVGDINGDGLAELAITPDEGGGPRVRVFSGNGFTQIDDFYGIDDPNFRGGARAAIGDLNGDGKGDLVVAAGFGGGPRVSAFDGTQLGNPNHPKLFGDFFAFETSLRNGIFVAAGDVNGDGFADIVAGGGPGGGPRVFILDGKSLVQNGSNTLVPIGNFFAGDSNSRGGVRVAVKNLDNDAKADIATGSGRGAGSSMTAYLGSTIFAGGTPTSAFDFDAFAGFTGGVFVG